MKDQFVGSFGCVIMASGFGKRFGENKLLADFLGQPMITKILDATEDLFEKRVVVTRYEAVAKFCRLREIPVVVHDLPYRSDTIRLGMEFVGSVDSCMFCPADQPLLTRKTIDSLLLCAKNDPELIWRPCHGQMPGAPVIFPKWTFFQLQNLPEGKGGNVILKKYPDKVRMMEIMDAWELVDADTPEILDRLKKEAL